MPSRQTEKNRRANSAHADEVIRDRYTKGYAHWSEYRIDGKLPLVRGRRFRVSGERGWFVFVDAGSERSGDCFISHLNCYGPFTKNSIEIHGNSRTFTPDRVIKVERSIWTQAGDVESKGERADRLGLNEIETAVAR
jgi:hypothetical protein